MGGAVLSIVPKKMGAREPSFPPLMGYLGKLLVLGRPQPPYGSFELDSAATACPAAQVPPRAMLLNSWGF